MSYLSGGRTRIPIRDTAREVASQGSGIVKSWVMSPEELEDYRARTGYKAPRNWDGEKISPPVQQRSERPNMSSEEQSVRENMKQTNKPDKQKFLELIAAEKSIAGAWWELGLQTNRMYYWLKKWDLVGIDPGKARELLGTEEPALLRSTSPVAEAVEEKARGLVLNKDLYLDRIQELLVTLQERNAEIASLRTAQEENCAEITEFKRLLAEATEERDNWSQEYATLEEEYGNLKVDCFNWKQVAENRKEEISELSEFLNEAKQRVRELEEIPRAKDPNSTFQTLQAIGVIQAATAVDNVNHPQHYLSGGIETIDFIRAKLTPEEFEGYCKGNILKYVARATLKGGIEDLRKAGKYIEFATKNNC